uniref:DNA-directed RNA polymerase subunit alpha n=1 Tax=Bangiopsis subsimplex TaxID=139980 RepID=A0A1C9CD00_9RHOD|nr:DNA-directed RNA polymerase alpha subunit [Bangiopsis subsimplex]AOM66255.1 DNA-directed RNA polymerase alpha subunit [Bangiopsis subsimplex]ARO90383.1 DNA-directed RNA polymerase subunit alpha [Bangiopsis subsimplex]
MSLLQIECLESRIDKPRDHYGQFAISPLRSSQAITIGNALRRTLLSDLEGTAIAAVKLAGVNHEFSTISGVREDVLEILLNLKSIIFRTQIQNSGLGRVRVQGPGIVTAGLLELPPGVELVDPRQYIATICNNSIFELEFRLETNTGYKIVNRGVDEKSLDFIQIDSKFMPVKKVNFFMDETQSNNLFEKETLLLEVWTNGSLTPQEAVSQSASLLTKLFNSLKNLDFKCETEDISTNEHNTAQIPIEELQLSVRAYNCLKRAQINSISDLLNYSNEELLEIKNFGQKSADEVIDALYKRFGIRLVYEKSENLLNSQ